MEKMAKNLDPKFIIVGAETRRDDLSAMFEYHRDPYVFCIDFEFIGNIDIDEVLRSESLKEIKQILPREELLELIEKHSDGIIKGREGIGVIRNNLDFEFVAYMYPRYFIRKELRRRGVKLKPGRTENLFINDLRTVPKAMKDIGFIDEELCGRIEEAKGIVKEKVQEKLVSSGKYERGLLEKYEEMNRKCSEYWERTRERDVELWEERKRLLYLRNEYLDEFRREYENEMRKAILEMLPEDMLKDLGFEKITTKNVKEVIK